jgi:hypothetical protein
MFDCHVIKRAVYCGCTRMSDCLYIYPAMKPNCPLGNLCPSVTLGPRSPRGRAADCPSASPTTSYSISVPTQLDLQPQLLQRNAVIRPRTNRTPAHKHPGQESYRSSQVLPPEAASVYGRTDVSLLRNNKHQFHARSTVHVSTHART